METIMIKKIIKFSLLIPLLASVLCSAKATVVFNPEKAIFSTNKALKISEELEKRIEPQKKRFNEISTELKKIEKEFKQDIILLNKNEITKRKEKITSLRSEYQKIDQYLHNIKKQEEEEFLYKIRPVLDRILLKIIEEKNISLILDKTAVIYTDPLIDITDEVISLLNKEKS